MSIDIRIPKRAPLIRQTISDFSGPVASDYSPFDPRNDAGFGMIRGQEPSKYMRAGQTVRLEGFERNAVVNACVRVIADQIGIAHLEAYSVAKDGAIELHPDHPLQTILDQPHQQLPGFSLRRMAGLQVAVYGNSYFAIIRDARGTPMRLRNVHPERMQHIIVNEDDEILEWTWTSSRGKQYHTSWDSMIHVRDNVIDPQGWFGFPRGLAAITDIVTDGEASTYVRQTLGNSGAPALVFFARQGSGNEELATAEARWHERMVMNGERGRTRFVGGVESLQVIGHTLKDLEFPSLRQVSREDICAAFGVDPRLIGIGSAKGNDGGLSGSQYQEARRRLEQQTCQPIRMSIQEAFDATLTPEYGFYYARFSPQAIAAIIETPTEVAQRVAVMIASNVLTLDEGRQITGSPAKMDPTHVTAAPMLQTVQEALQANARAAQQQAAQLAAKTTAAVQKGASVSEQVDGPDGITDANNNSGRAADAPATRQQPAPSRVRVQGQAMASDAALWASADAQARALESVLTATTTRAVKDTMLQVLTQLNKAHEPSSTRAVNDPWWSRFESGLRAVFMGGVASAAWTRMVSADMAPHIAGIASAFAAPLNRSVDTTTPQFAAPLRARWAAIADHGTRQMGQRLEEIVQTAREADLSADDLAGILSRTDWDGLVGRIASTQSVGVINHVDGLAASQLSLVMKRWLKREDEKVRASHEACGARGWIDIGSAFPNGLQFAHDPNGSAEEIVECRCFTLYADSQDALT